MREVLQFQPIYQERVWGGRRLQTLLGREIPPGPPVMDTLVAEIYGPTEAGRLRFAGEVERIFHSVDGVVDVDSTLNPTSPKLSLVLDREQAALEDGVGAARERILRRFEQHSSYCCGCAVEVEEDGGYLGVTRGLDERGFLRIETARGMRTVLSGGVRKR